MAIVRGLIFVLVVAGLAALTKLVFERVTGRALRLRYAVAAVIVALFAVFLVARHQRAGDEERIEHRLEALATSGDPRACDEAMTARYLTQITGEDEAFAQAACEATIPEGRVDELEVSGIEVDGDRAIAVEAPRGGAIDGSRLRVALVEDDGEWKLDRRLGFVAFDRAGFRREYQQRFLRFGSPRTAVACAGREERRLSDSEIKAAILSGRAARLFAPIAVECDRDGVERSVMGAVADFQPPPDAVACMEARVRSLAALRLARASSSYPAFDALVAGCDPPAFRRYLRRRLSADDLDPAVISCVLAALARLPATAEARLIYDYEAIDERAQACERVA